MGNWVIAGLVKIISALCPTDERILEGDERIQSFLIQILTETTAQDQTKVPKQRDFLNERLLAQPIIYCSSLSFVKFQKPQKNLT
jgi:hypothetical protein